MAQGMERIPLAVDSDYKFDPDIPFNTPKIYKQESNWVDVGDFVPVNRPVEPPAKDRSLTEYAGDLYSSMAERTGGAVNEVGNFLSAPIAGTKQIATGVFSLLSDLRAKHSISGGEDAKAVASTWNKALIESTDELVKAREVNSALGLSAPAEAISNAGTSAKQYWGGSMTPKGKAMAKGFEDAKGIDSLTYLFANPTYVPQFLAGVAPDTIIGMGMTKAAMVPLEISARAAATKAGEQALRSALASGASKEAAAAAGATAARTTMESAVKSSVIPTGTTLGAGIEAGQSALSAHTQIAEKIQELPQKYFDQNPDYAGLIRNGKTPQEARAILAVALAGKYAGATGMATLAGSIASGGATATATALSGARVTGKEALKNTGKDTLEEVLQGLGEDYWQYRAEKEVNPQAEYDPIKSAVSNALGGFGMGAPTHAASYINSRGMPAPDSPANPDGAIPASDIGAGPGGGSNAVSGEYIPAEPADPSSGLAAPTQTGTTYDQNRPELPPGQAMLPRPALPAPAEPGITNRQVNTAIGLLKHSPKASPEMLMRLMRVDEYTATLLFNHWKGIERESQAPQAVEAAQEGTQEQPAAPAINSINVSPSGNGAGPFSGNINVVPSKIVVDSWGGNAKRVGDFLDVQTLRSKGLEFLDAPSQRMVLSAVIARAHDPEILDSVVGPYAVDMVNMLSGKQLTPEMLREHPSVLKNLPAIPPNVDVSIFSNPSARSGFSQAVRAVAGLIAETPVVSQHVPLSGNWFSTPTAIGRNSSGLSSAGLGAERPILDQGSIPSESASTGFANKIDQAAHEAATSPLNDLPDPTPAQKDAGNYKKGDIWFHGLRIRIENPQGSKRSGIDKDGNPWETLMNHHYGYIVETSQGKAPRGRDKDHLDVFLKPGAERSDTAFVIDQIDPNTGKYDEHKIILGAQSASEAQDIYHANYQAGWRGMGAITAMPIAEFKQWLKSGDTKKPVALSKAASQESTLRAQLDQAQAAGNSFEVQRLAHEINQARKQPQEPAKAPAREPGSAYGKVGTNPLHAAPVTLQDNGDGTATVMRGTEPFVDYESGEDVKVASGATPVQVRDAIKKSGALSSKDKHYGVAGETESAKTETKPAQAVTEEPKAEAIVGKPVTEMSDDQLSKIATAGNSYSESAKEKAKAELERRSADFIKAPDGSIDFGEVPALSSKLKDGKEYPAKPVRMEVGGDFGKAHIQPERLAGFQENGYATEAEMLNDVAKHYTHIYEQPNGRLLLVKRNGRAKFSVVELQPHGAYYGVSTLFLEDANPKGKPYEERGGRILLWPVAGAASSGSDATFPATTINAGAEAADAGESIQTIADQPNEGKTEEAHTPDIDAELQDAIAHLGDVLNDVLGTQLKMSGPEHSAKDLLPALSKVIELLVKKGFHSFRAAVSNAAKLMRASKNTAAFVDRISARQWKAAYNSVAEFLEGTDSEEAVNALTPVDVEEIVGNVKSSDQSNDRVPATIDYKGFTREDKAGGAFDLVTRSVRVHVEPMGDGKYQASFGGAKSSPHIQGEQGAVDWAANYLDEMKRTAEPKKEPPKEVAEDVSGIDPALLPDFREIIRLAKIAGTKNREGNPLSLADIAAAYENFRETETFTKAGAIKKTLADQMEKAKEELLNKAWSLYSAKFNENGNGKIVPAVKNGALDISGEPWAADFYQLFNIDPKKISKFSTAGLDEGVAEQLAKFQAGQFALPSNISGANAEGRKTAKEQNDTRSRDYVKAARIFLEGDLTAKIPVKKDATLNAEFLENVRVKPIERTIKRVKNYADQINALLTIAADNDIRYYLSGVHVEPENKRLVATDGHRMVVLNDADLSGVPQMDGTKTVLNRYYGQKKAGVNSTTTDVWHDGKFPDWQRVVPSKHWASRGTFNAKRVGDQARGLVKAWRYITASMGNVAIDIGGNRATFNPAYIADAADLFRAFGYESFTASIENQNYSMLLESPDMRIQQVIMPTRNEIANPIFLPIADDAGVAKQSSIQTKDAADTKEPDAFESRGIDLENRGVDKSQVKKAVDEARAGDDALLRDLERINKGEDEFSSTVDVATDKESIAVPPPVEIAKETRKPKNGEVSAADAARILAGIYQRATYNKWTWNRLKAYLTKEIEAVHGSKTLLTSALEKAMTNYARTANGRLGYPNSSMVYAAMRDYGMIVEPDAKPAEIAGKPVAEMSDKSLDDAAKSSVASEGAKTKAKTETKRRKDSETATPKSGPVEGHYALMNRLREGTATLDEYKAGFESLLKNEAAIKADLSSKTKDDLLKMGGGQFARSYKSDPKARVVDGLFRDMVSDYALHRPVSYMLGSGNGHHDAIVRMVEGTTAETLQQFADKVKESRVESDARTAAIIEGIKNPTTLEHFENYIRHKSATDKITIKEARMSLTPEQRAKYDILVAEKTREARSSRADAKKTEITAAATNATGKLVESKHAKTGEALFVVQSDARVERDVYNQWNATAKRLGGYYSSYRGGGAIPGFTFRDRGNAESFLKYIGGDITDAKETAQQERDAFKEDRTQTAAERLNEMADRLEANADAALAIERKENTARRARMAAGAEAAANSDKALAQTMRNIAKALTDGTAKFLDQVRQKTQVEMLRSIVIRAQYAEQQAKYPSYAEQERHKGERPTQETADFAPFPRFTAFRSDLAKLARQMIGIDGLKKTGAELLKVADDVTDAYMAFVKANLHKVSTFKKSDGTEAVFVSKEDAENAIRRSNLKGQAIPMSIKRGQHLVIMSPALAKEKGIWQGDDDTRVSIPYDLGREIVAKNKDYANYRLPMPYMFQNVADDLNRLKAIGIETPFEFRAALREFIAMQEPPKQRDRVKELERAMIGRRNDGLDFFPTPAETAQAMIDAADLKPGMAVLEPSAGMGHIADQIRSAGVDPDVVEMANDRKELLEAKGYNVVGRDFMELDPRDFTYGDVFKLPDGRKGVMRGSGGLGSGRVGFMPLDASGNSDQLSRTWENREDLTGVEKRGVESGYDRIIMNPPFGDRRDAEHVRHAYTLLKPGGRVVALMGEGVFFGQDKKAQEFRDWLEQVGGTSEKLEEGTFNDPSLPVNTSVNARMVVIDKPEGKGMESRAGYNREAFAANALQELASEDELFRYPVSQAGTLKGVFNDVFPGVEWHGESTQADEKDASGADHRYTMKTPDTPAKDGKPEVIGKQFEVYVTRDRVWIDVHRFKPGDQGSRVYAAVANFAYNTRRIFGGDPKGVSVDAIIARTKMMLASALRFGTTRHLDASSEQEKGIRDHGVAPLDWSGNDIDKIRALIHTFITTVQNNAPAIKNYRYDFARRLWINNTTGLEFHPSFAAFVGALGRDQRRAAGIGADSGRAAILIQSLISEEGRSLGDGGILQAILDYASSLVSKAGGLKGVFSKATPAQAGVSASGGTDSIAATQSVVDKFKAQFKGTDALDVRVVRTTQDIPARFRPSPFAEGVFHDDAGLIYLVTMNLKTKDGQINTGRVWQVMLHESVGHFGLARMMGARFSGILKQVMQAAKAKNPVQQETEEFSYQPGHADYATVDAVRLRYPEASEADVAQEVLARMAETDPGRTLFGYVRAVVRQWLRDMARAFGVDLDVTTAELNDLVALASRYMRKGENLSEEDAPTGFSAASRRGGMESRAAPPGANSGPIWSAPESSRADDLIYTMQDKNIDLKRVQQGIKKAIGDIRDDIDAYLQEELFHGRAAQATEEFLERELNPFIGEMKQRGIDMDTLETFLWARHANERNAQIAKINPDMRDGGSGLTNTQAAALLAGKDVMVQGQKVTGVPQSKLRSLNDLARKVDMMIAGNRMLLELYELETPDTIAAWKGAYKHYVPLHREDADSPWTGNGTGQGYSVKGASTKRATGSFRPVENILANIVLQRTRTITRGEKNRVAQALYGLAKESPNDGFWETDNPPTIKTVENKAIYHVMDGTREMANKDVEVSNFTNLADAQKLIRKNPGYFMYQDRGDRVVEKIDPAFRSKPNVVWARFGGEDRFVIFNERDERAMRLAGSLKNLDADDISNLLGEVSRWTRYFASINTQYNPVFGVINLIRDTGTGLINLQSTPLAGKQKELLGNVWQALPAIYKAVRIDRKGGTPTGTWADLWEDFQEAGGKTGYRDMFKNSHEQREALEMALDETWWQSKWWGKALTVGGVLSVPEQLLADKIGKPIFQWLSDYNTMMENAIRLSAYKVALDSGLSKERAASLSKNLTVNFNKKGQVARQAGALYAFFNASVQGTARMAETLRYGAKPGELLGKTGKQIVYGGMMLGALQAMLLMMAGFDDDEPPDFVRDRNIIIPVGGGKYLTVPLPLGYHVLPAIGRIGTEFVLGGFKKSGKHIAHVFDVLADSFNPIGNAGLSMQSLAPTVLDPAAALSENKDWTGKPIYRENMSGLDLKPGYARTKDVATGLSKALAYAINIASGGTEFKPGLLSPTPDQIDYLIGQVTGGVGRETSKAFQTGSAIRTGEDLPPHKIPLLGRFYGDTKAQSAVSGRFYGNLKEMNEHQAEYMGLIKSDRSEQADKYLKDNPEAEMFHMADRVHDHISRMREEKRKMLSSGEPKAKIKEIDDGITSFMREFNQEVDAQKNRNQRGMARVGSGN